MVKKNRGHPPMSLLVELIGQAYNRRSWHGTNLRGALRGLALKEALWRPSPGRHNIWEIMVHCAYWKYVVRRRILGEKRGSFPLKGSNWFHRNGTLTVKDWNADLRLLDDCHRSLLEALGTVRASDLGHAPANSTVSNAMIISGIASHDLYHAGQIQLLKRLMK